MAGDWLWSSGHHDLPEQLDYKLPKVVLRELRLILEPSSAEHGVDSGGSWRRGHPTPYKREPRLRATAVESLPRPKVYTGDDDAAAAAADTAAVDEEAPLLGIQGDDFGATAPSLAPKPHPRMRGCPGSAHRRDGGTGHTTLLRLSSQHRSTGRLRRLTRRRWLRL
ncbi:hypothetical protein E2562_000455 [Oryza meyeriana var. granulata]|uniref:Uncharacterized protein n=1 Tax=Oryza meyeriana var. granulata TaxID=110450 RepID=A0A6G1CDP0_9ORYZ|nr:hypothetical protein E2562_000455 [Oryza meyeriana var. granulata]